MGKATNNGKQSKKQPLMTPKEKKAAKQAKKHPQELSPLAPK